MVADCRRVVHVDDVHAELVAVDRVAGHRSGSAVDLDCGHRTIVDRRHERVVVDVEVVAVDVNGAVVEGRLAGTLLKHDVVPLDVDAGDQDAVDVDRIDTAHIEIHVLEVQAAAGINLPDHLKRAAVLNPDRRGRVVRGILIDGDAVERQAVHNGVHRIGSKNVAIVAGVRLHPQRPRSVHHQAAADRNGG